MREAGLPPATRLAVLEQYFGCLRAGHAGQALDIGGLDDAIESVLAGALDARMLEARLTAVHRLKTGVPAASLVRIGAILGGADERTIAALGRYQEAVGIAFQIMDDVLNLRGLYANKADKTALAGVALKTLGEDISSGKCTYPVVKAFAKLSREEAASLWARIAMKSTDREVVDGVIAALEACGAIDACIEHAKKLVEDGFAEIDCVLPDSMAKVMLRAFGLYIVQHAGG
jgi:geranylgeranyl pyrophosphate synthase